jgi:hypothetical protein
MFSNNPRVRQIVYGLAVASQIASFFVAIVNPDLANAFVATAGVLSTVAGVTALTNVHANAVVDSYPEELGYSVKADDV